MPELPSGRVTLLFSDVEGSTRLVRTLGHDYGRVLERHRSLIRGSAVRYRGHEVDCRGDEMFFAFDDAHAAVAAADEAQRALAAHPWPEGARVRVRMGVHTGDPVLRGDSYYGVDVHRAARVSQAGHGGQVLLSETTAFLVGEAHDLRDLGAHRLRGLPEPERIFQLGHGQFPALNAARGDVPPSLRVALAEDSVLLREGIALLLENSGCSVIAQVSTAEELLAVVAAERPDVVITDIKMPPTHSDEGLRAAGTIRRRFPGTGVLVLSQYAEPAYARELMENGAEGIGYLLKDRVAQVDEFAAAVRTIAAGGSVLDPAVTRFG
jgi:class 3 adenylate cyclase/ActR/RegA family two-component response regulator